MDGMGLTFFLFPGGGGLIFFIFIPKPWGNDPF